MFCRSCGKQLNDDAQFCNGCGLQLKAPEGAPAAPEQPSETVPEQVTAPFPAVGAPPVPDAAPRRSNAGLIIALVVVGILVVGAAVMAGLYFTGVFEKVGVVASRTDEGTSSSTKKGAVSKEDTASADPDDASDDANALSDEESYDLIVKHYVGLGNLSAEVGKANTSGEYGGTGFAYEVFNKKIGVSDASIREKLVAECQAMLDAVSGAKQGLDASQVAASYAPQKSTILGLYVLLEKRMQAMLGAAEAAVGNPSESAWRPILTPASTETRERFDSEYPGAEPVRQ